MSIHPVTSVEVFSNARVKMYPSHDVFQVSNAPIFRAPGWEARERSYDVPPKGEGKDKERSKESAMRRARASVRDIALCNHFTHFFTWTLSPEKIDRYDADAVKKVTMDFLKNMVKRKGFSYVLVPELHKDGAIHFHGLCCLGELRAVPAVNAKTGKLMYTDRGQQIFNLPDWKLGFSECVELDENYEQTCNYLTKYFTKGTKKVFGKWYFSSRSLRKKPDIAVIPLGVDFEQAKRDFPDAVTLPLYRDVCMISTKLPEVVKA